MPKKAVPIAHARKVATPDEWVEHKPGSEPEQPAEPLVRVSVDLPKSLHTLIKIDCARHSKTIADAFREMAEQRWRPNQEAA